ncbi:sulfite dehydrogenase (cytochrome) subunit SorA apoprotein [Actinomycetospora succinea]|uniref:Sulfite dehydrogenase (Cytochrome) subunit SorA apoprotein n=1 Tax=Actinomycetospora succinea TaxID=663603 RepID=A0A4R6VPA0_9PSEU|nr:sulfite oxidase [Actinomycetospora succinea]TDQ65141.1 sulfite dehydrogenase (cytochrome) subunit SorA apoprotein [Actinomycetospora succinea]
MVVHEEDPYNAEPPRSALAEHAITPVETFYSRNHGELPELDPQRWRLQVDGLVDEELSLSLDELRRFEHHEVTATLQCAGNRRAGLLAVRDIPGQHPWGDGATSTARWVGARLADVLAAAGLRHDASNIAFAAPDIAPEATPPAPYGGSITTGKATSPEVLLAWVMNGEPLTVAHGAPVRVVVPGWIGARSVKWVERITAQHHPSDNFFQQSAYRLLPPDHDDPAPGDGVELTAVALNSAILRPDEGAVMTAGPTEVTGYAFAGGDRDVVRVDVSADGGRTWHQAELDDQLGAWAWRFWRTTLELRPGEHEIVARAWDSTAALQPEHAASLWNPKGYINNAWPTVSVTAEHPPEVHL